MEKTQENIYNLINKTNDENILIDLFYEQFNTRDSIDALPACIKIVNKIKSMKDEYTEEESLLFLELRNLYILCMSKVYQVLYHLKYESDLKMTSKEIDNKVFLGFGMLAKKENQDPDVKEFVSKNMISDIFNNTFPNHKFDIERDLHLRYNSKDKLIKIGIIKAITNIIYTYDPYLADYILCNISILDEYKDKINYFLDNYDSYEKENEKNKYRFMIEEVRDYCKEADIDSEEYLLRIAAELNILNKVIEYSDEYGYDNYALVKDIVSSACRNDIDINYMNVKSIINQYIKTRIVGEKLCENPILLLEKELDCYIRNFNNMSEEKQLEVAEKILKKTKTSEEYDHVINYIKKPKKNNNILLFEKKKGI